MSKKTESIEIRGSPELKSALAEVSTCKGRSMSDTVRDLIEGEVEGRGQPTPTPAGEPVMLKSAATQSLRAALIAVPVLALATLYLFSAQSPATANAEIRVFFTEVDVNADDRITLEEVNAFLHSDTWRAEPDCASTAAPCTLAEYAEIQMIRADADGSGFVTYGEFEAVNLRDWAEDFLAMDLDENGVVEADEVMAFDLFWQLDGADPADLSPACQTHLTAENLPALLQSCTVSPDARADARSVIAAYDRDRSGGVTLLEYLNP